MAETISRGQGWLIVGLLAAIGYGLYYGAQQAEAALSSPASIIGGVGNAITSILGGTTYSTEPVGQPASSGQGTTTPII